jgi:hypothetical protein
MELEGLCDLFRISPRKFQFISELLDISHLFLLLLASFYDEGTMLTLTLMHSLSCNIF